MELVVIAQQQKRMSEESSTDWDYMTDSLTSSCYCDLSVVEVIIISSCHSFHFRNAPTKCSDISSSCFFMAMLLQYLSYAFPL
ncbi:hypothetical protein T11_4550 [Trichinella zimbabwensis]|uniref:Uncharacterized protein n=1 Tax=Trichinella zimbabwensis TaxID=268475 RepID=A0A0V1HU40_9BILA|nr:hypothetical protein T11_4550 [Trichinella zimbabwensis]